ncbi:MAG: redoxin domain-containing protein [Chitinophagales bacterium]|jgi:thiol-disulfide isomerase/thioredoxin
MTIKRMLFAVLSTFSLLHGFAQKGYEIKVKLENYPPQELILGFHYGDKQYVKDTAQLASDGYFTFRADTLFKPGVYLLVLKPDNKPIEFMLPADDQVFTLTTDALDPVAKMRVKGSDDNTAFFNYLKYLGEQRVFADTIRAQMGRTKSKSDSLSLQGQLTGLDEKVKKAQLEYIAKNASSVGAKVVKGSIEPEIPSFAGTTDDKELQRKRYFWYREHFFDNLNLSDPVYLRSPLLHPKIDQFMTKIVPQHPDSVNAFLDTLYRKMEGSPETHRFYVTHFLNFYAKSQLVGFDACYVHVGKNYFCKATWPGKDNLEKVCDNVRRLEPILIGKTAPNIVVKDKNNANHALYDVDADYTVLFFWAPDCGHCKKAAPFLVDFAKKYKDKGVKVFNVCTAVGDKGGECWKGVEEKGFDDTLFFNYYDPYLQSRYKTLYDVQTTPQIFILDRKHEILMKRIGAEQLDKVMEQTMEIEANKKKEKK